MYIRKYANYYFQEFTVPRVDVADELPQICSRVLQTRGKLCLFLASLQCRKRRSWQVQVPPSIGNTMSTLKTLAESERSRVR